MSAPTPKWLTNLNLPDLPDSQSQTQETSPSSTSDALGGGDADLDWMNSLEAWTTFDFGQPQQQQQQQLAPQAKPSSYKEYKKRTQDGAAAVDKGFDVPGFGQFLGSMEHVTAADGSNVVNGASTTSETLDLPDFALADSSNNTQAEATVTPLTHDSHHSTPSATASAPSAPATSDKSAQKPRGGQNKKLKLPDNASTLDPEDLANRIAMEEDKRRRNTAASARFRMKKKEREQATAEKNKELLGRVGELERQVGSLREENTWLRGLVQDQQLVPKGLKRKADQES